MFTLLFCSQKFVTFYVKRYLANGARVWQIFSKILTDNLSHCVIGEIEEQIFLQTVCLANFFFDKINLYQILFFIVFRFLLERFLLLKKGTFFVEWPSLV